MNKLCKCHKSGMSLFFKRLFVTCWAVLFALPVVVQAAGLSDEEKRLIQLVNQHHEEQVNFLEKVVNINSGTMSFKGVRKVGNVFAKEFKAIGLTPRWIDLPETNRAGHLFAAQRGTQGKKLLLIGHLDTVFEQDSSFQTFNRKGNTAYGPGVTDMKDGDVIILYALKALHAAGLLKNVDVTVAFLGDEEDAGQPLAKSRGDLIAAAKYADAALAFESGQPGLGTIGRRGSSGWKLEVTGKRSHSSGIFRKGSGSGAAFELTRIINTFYNEMYGEEFLTFNPSLILGGSELDVDVENSSGSASGKINVIASKAFAKGDVRFISSEQRDKTKQRMRDIVARHLPKTSAQITFWDKYPAMTPTKGNEALLKVLSQISQELGQDELKPMNPGLRGAGDVSHVAEYVDSLDGLGGWGSGSHTVREQLNLDSFLMATQRTVLLIYRLTR